MNNEYNPIEDETFDYTEGYNYFFLSEEEINSLIIEYTKF